MIRGEVRLAQFQFSRAQEAFVEALLGQYGGCHPARQQLQNRLQSGSRRFEAVSAEVVIEPAVGNGADCLLQRFVFEGGATRQIGQTALVRAFMVGADFVEQRGADSLGAVILAHNDVQAVVQCVGVSRFFSGRAHGSHSVVWITPIGADAHVRRAIGSSKQNAWLPGRRGGT